MAVDLKLKAPMLLTQAFAAGMVKNKVLQPSRYLRCCPFGISAADHGMSQSISDNQTCRQHGLHSPTGPTQISGSVELFVAIRHSRWQEKV